MTYIKGTISYDIDNLIEVTTYSDPERVFLSASTAVIQDRNLPIGPRKNWGAWRCAYCGMIVSGKLLNCDYCGGPGQL